MADSEQLQRAAVVGAGTSGRGVVRIALVELVLPQFRPAPLLRRMVSEGWLGERSGRGFDRYDASGRRLPVDEDLATPSIDALLNTAPDTAGAEPGNAAP